MERRRFIKIFSVAALGAVISPDTKVSNAQSLDSKRDIERNAYLSFAPEPEALRMLRALNGSSFYRELGSRSSGVVQTQDGNLRVMFQKGLVEGAKTGSSDEFKLAKINEEFTLRGFDKEIREKFNPSFPPNGVFKLFDKNRVERVRQRMIAPPLDLVVKTQLLRRDGIESGILKGASIYPETEIYRLEALTFIKSGHDLNIANVDNLARRVNFWPKQAFLDEPTDDLHQESLYRFANGNWDIKGLIELFAQGNAQTGEPEISFAEAKGVCFCESRFNPVVNSSGLWQVMGNDHVYTSLGLNAQRDSRNAYRNTIVAKEIKRTQGMRAWSCWKRRYDGEVPDYSK